MPFTGMIAESDLRTKQFHAVKFSGTGKSFRVELADAAADIPCGILQNTPDEDQTCTISSPGDIGKAKIRGAVSSGDRLTFSTTNAKHGWLETADGTDICIARALMDGTDEDIIQVITDSPAPFA